MKIIKIGYDVKAWKYNIICHWCNSEIEITCHDLRFSGEDGNWHENGWERYSANCIACNQELIIDNTKIPNLVKAYAQGIGKNFWSQWLS